MQTYMQIQTYKVANNKYGIIYVVKQKWMKCADSSKIKHKYSCLGGNQIIFK